MIYVPPLSVPILNVNKAVAWLMAGGGGCCQCYSPASSSLTGLTRSLLPALFLHLSPLLMSRAWTRVTHVKHTDIEGWRDGGCCHGVVQHVLCLGRLYCWCLCGLAGPGQVIIFPQTQDSRPGWRVVARARSARWWSAARSTLSSERSARSGGLATLRRSSCEA